MKWQSKARNLLDLTGKLQSAKILPMLVFSKSEVEQDLGGVCLQILDKNWAKMIVRSSSKNEDSISCSHAGEFMSVQNVNTQNLQNAIVEVISSLPNNDDEIFIQPMLENITLFGVAMSALNGANYVNINIDTSGNSYNLTAGNGLYDNYIVLRGFRLDERYQNHNKLNAILDLIDELCELYESEFIDIELAFIKGQKDKLDDLYLLQVRPMANISVNKALDLRLLSDMISKKFSKLSASRPHLYGQRSILGIMPDWNPAEILGLRPKRLSISLYKELITDNVWAYGRDKYGYKNLRSFPLMVDFAGLCYIDTRVSFNSFLPRTLSDELSKKLVDFYLDKLEESPAKHDKIEFDIVFSAYEFDLKERLAKCDILSKDECDELYKGLKDITISLFNKDSRFYLDLKRIDELLRRFESLQKSNLASIDMIYWLIEETKRYGTLSFSGIARAAFVATSLLNSLVRIDLISKEEKDQFLSSFSTISGDINRDLYSLNKEEFLAKYGHLRANTYDITSPRYDKAWDLYFNKDLDINTDANITKNLKTFKPQNKKAIKKILKENGFKLKTHEFFDFIALAIKSREYSKFVFTMVLSEVLEQVSEYLAEMGISREDAAFLDIKVLLGFYTTLDSIRAKDIVLANIAKNKKEYEYTKALCLPHLIAKNTDIYAHKQSSNEPNYITQKSISAPKANINDGDIKGKIVCLKNADPGFDFIFSQNIAGLITAYGGANSHMAVRCSEFGLPAAIGVGTRLFELCENASIITLDCLNQRIICE